jgi:formylglycine-generating enzyme required for sulfatase activity
MLHSPSPAIPDTPRSNERKPADNPAAPLPKETKNSLGMKLVLIPPGKFLMGSPDSDNDVDANEKPQHEVEITKAFYLSVHTVTVGQFRSFVSDTGYQTEAETDAQGGFGYNEQTHAFAFNHQYSWKDPGWYQTNEHPVVNITWNDAVKFCQWLSRREGQKYRLPTEAEWEYCCRAGTNTRYYCGDEGFRLRDVANVADASYKKKDLKAMSVASWDDGFPFTAPVGRFKPNAFGLYDMHGNVWQWCADWYGENYYKTRPRKDPQGPRAGSVRIQRGSGFQTSDRACRAAVRYSGWPTFRGFSLGFRVVRALADQRDAPKLTKP